MSNNGPCLANDGTPCANTATRDEINRRLTNRPVEDNADSTRATRAEAAIQTSYFDADPATNLRDILTDLRHWADVFGIDFDEADSMASDHYYTETD